MPRPAPSGLLLRCALLFLAALPGISLAARGDVHLDIGAGTVLPEAGLQPAVSGRMGFRIGAGEGSELRLGVDYGRFLPTERWAPRLELQGASLGAAWVPYPGPVQPSLGAQMGMVRIDDDWRLDLGLQAQVLARLAPLAQAYLSVEPGLWMAEPGPELWVKMGLGLRFRLIQ